MKRFISAVLCLLILVSVFAGCKASQKSLDIAAFSEKAVSEGSFGDDLLPLTEKLVGDYYSLPAGVSEYRIYVSATSATASELAVFKCKDEGAVKELKAAVETRVSEQIGNYENYRPDEKFRLENALIKTEGSYLLFVVSDDNAAIEKLFTDSLK